MIKQQSAAFEVECGQCGQCAVGGFQLNKRSQEGIVKDISVLKHPSYYTKQGLFNKLA